MIRNNSITSEYVNLTGINGPYEDSIQLKISRGGDSSSGSNAWVWILVIVVGIILIGLIVVGVKKFGGDENDDA